MLAMLGTDSLSGLTLLAGGLDKGLCSIGICHPIKRIYFKYAQPGFISDLSMKKRESWMLSAFKIVFWVKH